MALSLTNVVGQLQKAADLLSTVADLDTKHDNLIATAEGEYAAEFLNAANAVVNANDSAVSPNRVRTLLDPVLLHEAERIGANANSGSTALPFIQANFATNSRSVQTRSIVFGTGTFSGTGTGNFYRVTTDKNGDSIESCAYPKDTTVVVECIEDANTSAGRTFEIRGTKGANATMNETGSIVPNGSFDSLSPTTNGVTVENIPNWTVGSSLSNLKTEISDVFRTDNVVNRAVRFTADESLETAAIRLDDEIPYVALVAYKRSGANGTLKLQLGAQTDSVSLSTTTGWGRLKCSKHWYEELITDSVKLKLIVTGMTTGYVIVDDVILAPMTEHDSVFYAVTPGATPFLLGDKKTYTDSETGAKIQRWLAVGYGSYLPSSGTPTVADP